MAKLIKHLVPAVFLMMAACGVLVEIDISDEEVVLVAPSDSVTIEGTEVSFRWDWVEGATEYVVTVVSPNFDQIETLDLDTAVQGERTTTITKILEEEDYQWSVVAKNSEYQTVPTVRSFKVVEDLTVPSIENEVITVISPANGGTTTDLDITFRWSEVADASGYVISVYHDDVNRLRVFEDLPVKQPKTSFLFDAPGETSDKYVWEVMAVNRRDSTDLFEFKFTIQRESTGQQ